MTTGYPQFAKFLAEFPGTASFRKFGGSSFKSLLYLQAEIAHLEEKLDSQEQIDKGVDSTKCFSTNWEKMWHASDVCDDSDQRKIMDDLIEKLEKYHFLAGIEAEIWDDRNYDDLAAVRIEGDRFDDLLTNTLWPLYHRFIGRHQRTNVDPEKGLGPLREYSQTSFIMLGNICCVVLSSVVFTGAIFSLFYVHSMLTRLLMIGAYNFVFSGILMFMVGCRRAEVFGATAAFAAVQVVFIQGITS